MNRRLFFRNTGMAAGGLFLSDQLLKACQTISAKPALQQPLYSYPNYNLGEIYFSMAGSYLTIAPRQGSNTGRLHLRTCRRSAVSQKESRYWAHDYYELALTKNGKEIAFVTKALPWGLEITAENVKGRIAFYDINTLLIEIAGADINLIPLQSFGWKYYTDQGNFNLLFHPAQCIHQLRTATQKKVELKKNSFTTDEMIPETMFIGGNAVNSVALRESRAEEAWNDSIPLLEKAWSDRKNEVDSWMTRMPEVDKEFMNGAQLSWFILWNCQVAPAGKYTRTSILMTKNWMNQVWSWDNCFNAMAVASADPVLAWDQLLVMFDNQLPNGILPDAINDLDIHNGYVKPPVYGWTIKKLIDIIGLEPCKPYLNEIYPKLSAQTEWWFNYRDMNKNGLCSYLHGNDSGWDNSTAFDQGYPTEGADLAAHLALQCEALADFAEILGKGVHEINMWKSLSQKQMTLLTEKCVSNGRFVSPLESTGVAAPSSSLLNYIPAVLGSRLPKDVMANLVRDLSPGGPYMTEFGLATEPPSSPKFQPDGYWRGPIWAPSSYLIFDGLSNAGETELAKEIAVRFCRMCEKDPAMWENYHAVSGKGLRAPAYTWTAAVFILFANWLSYQKQ